MTQRLKYALLALVATGAAWFAPAAKADEWDKRTVMTFNEPVEIPGKVLPAGTYVFKLLDSESDRTVVQIFTEDQKRLVATVIAIPDYREEPADKTIVTLEERPSGLPEALHSWFYPGDNYGVQFVYRNPERQYAARSEEPVAAPAPPVQMVAANPVEPEPVPAFLAEREVVIAQAAPPEDNSAPAENEPAPMPDTLPQTAGNFAMIPLLGIVLLSGGFTAIRYSTRHN